jgi:hypothetical protein
LTDQSTKPNLDTTTPTTEFLQRQLRDLGPASYALLVGVLYVLGFLVLNTNLAKSGVVDYEFVDARYILSGSVFFYFLVCFYLFAGRTVVQTPQWLKEDLTLYQKLGLSSKWSLIVFFNSLANAGFSCCLSAGLFSLTAFGDRESAFFYAILAVAFIVLYWFDTTNSDIRHPRTHLLLLLATRLAATIAFFSNPESGLLSTTFSLTVALFFFINLVLDSITRHGPTKDRLTYSSIYAVVILMTIAIAFGATLYGNVSIKIGGARPQTVELSLTDEARRQIPKNWLNKSNEQISAKLIHQTDKFVYLSILEKTVRLRATDVVALSTSPDKQMSFWTELIQNKTTAPSIKPHAPQESATQAPPASTAK